MTKIAELAKERLQLRTVSFKKVKEVLPYAIFELINETYKHLYNVVPLSDEQVSFISSNTSA